MRGETRIVPKDLSNKGSLIEQKTGKTMKGGGDLPCILKRQTRQPPPKSCRKKMPQVWRTGLELCGSKGAAKKRVRGGMLTALPNTANLKFKQKKKKKQRKLGGEGVLRQILQKSLCL